MKRIYLVIVLICFAVSNTNAQIVAIGSSAHNFDNYYTDYTWAVPYEFTQGTYNDKLFYIPAINQPGNMFNFVDRLLNYNAGDAGTNYANTFCGAYASSWWIKMFYTFGSDPTKIYSSKYIPTTVGTTNVNRHVYYWRDGRCDGGGYPVSSESVFNSFKITVEHPHWNSNFSEIQNICQNVNRDINLADYFSVPGVTFNLDHAGLDTIWYDPEFNRPFTKGYQLNSGMYTRVINKISTINPHNLTPGVHTLYALKTYDNGVTRTMMLSGSRAGEVEFPITFTVLPGGPQVENVSVTPSCPGAPNGTVAISGVKGGSGSYKYMLRKGKDNTSPCTPPACFDLAAWGDFSGGNYTINNLPAGEYTLWVANNGGTAGACAYTKNVSIPQLSKMDTLPIAIQHISCPAGNNGSINVTATGGRTPYTYTLNSGGNTWNNANGTFNSLMAGTYFLITEDGCGQKIQRTIDLTAPAPVTITATASTTDCNLPANGVIEVNVSGGSGTFDYYLYDNNGNTVVKQLGSTSTNWQIPAVGAGKYTVSVENPLTPGCTPSTQRVEVFGPQALYINYISQTDNTCSYDAMGTLALSGGGGQENGYIFFLQNTATGDLIQSTTGNFSNLPAAAYKAWIRNADLSCLDSTIYASPITILSPPVLTSIASATDITCNGKGNGILQSSINGGTPGYNLQWQQWESQAANWLPVSGRTGTTENNLEQGRYRLLVTDQRNCFTYSNTVDIAEPNTLTITSVNRTDIVCYGETGSIQMTVSGGNISYVYAYSIDNGQSWNAFTAATPLPAASYQVKVSDNKGCETIYNQPVDITTPASQLSMNYTLTDYNGFNVPCYGSTNGVVVLTAAGGNGSNYSGYTYSVDNGPYGVSNKVTTNAGNHTFYVKDARGCIVNASASLTEPAAQIRSTVATTDNDCAGGQAGIITVSTLGGTPQYTYSINGTTFQSSNVFNALAAGNYQVTARDVNGCISYAPASIIDLNPPISDKPVINDVLCYNGSDGKITLSPSGGVPAYNYTWKGSAVSGNVLSGLPTGSYAVVITDSKGCTLSETFAVGQPGQPLSATTYARPVCVNNPYGNILFTPQGGTPPYQYSINSGSNYSNSAQFNNIPAGTYPIKVADANGCTFTGSTTVAVNGITPALNFLVSTSQNALDTLQVKEVCTPKPDSIQWTFDPQTVVIDNNMYTPLIRFNKEGNYMVSMRAWFGGCDFTDSKLITINPYDPNVVNNYNNLFGIDTAIVSPNPNNGNFNLRVKLYRNQRLLIKIYSIAGIVLWNKQWNYTSEVSEPISLPSNIGNGLVFIKVLTDDDVRDVEMLISK